MWFLRFGAFAIVALVACSRIDADLRSWRPSDHDQAPVSSLPGQSTEPTENPSVTPTAAPQDAQTTWTSLCAGCHGQLGLGNGPMGARVGAKNLSDPRWQSSVTDQQISSVILNGQGRMPAFSLRPDAVRGLVELIRKHLADPRTDTERHP
jgi:mono/diheme cytochrome c family protein